MKEQTARTSTQAGDSSCELPVPVPGVTEPGAACGDTQPGGVYVALWAALSLAFTLPSYREWHGNM